MLSELSSRQLSLLNGDLNKNLALDCSLLDSMVAHLSPLQLMQGEGGGATLHLHLSMKELRYQDNHNMSHLSEERFGWATINKACIAGLHPHT